MSETCGWKTCDATVPTDPSEGLHAGAEGRITVSVAAIFEDGRSGTCGSIACATTISLNLRRFADRNSGAGKSPTFSARTMSVAATSEDRRLESPALEVASTLGMRISLNLLRDFFGTDGESADRIAVAGTCG